ERGTIKGGTNKTQVAASMSEVRAVFDAISALEQQGRGMEALRRGYPNDLDKVRQCGEQMRARQPQARALRERAEGQPQPYSMYLDSAATELVLCVSCARSALENCDRTRSALDNASREMKRR